MRRSVSPVVKNGGGAHRSRGCWVGAVRGRGKIRKGWGSGRDRAPSAAWGRRGVRRRRGRPGHRCMLTRLNLETRDTVLTLPETLLSRIAMRQTDLTQHRVLVQDCLIDRRINDERRSVNSRWIAGAGRLSFWGSRSFTAFGPEDCSDHLSCGDPKYHSGRCICPTVLSRRK